MYSLVPLHRLLKSPLHSLNLDDLLSVYPDAELVIMHRDVYSVLCTPLGGAWQQHQRRL